MKKLTLTIALAALMVSCGGNDQNQMYNKATKYLDGKINDEKEKGSMDFLSLDTLVELSSRDLESVKRMPLMKEYKQALKAYEGFKEIDDRYDTGEENSETIHYRKKAIELNDSLISWFKKDAALDSTNVAGYMVRVKAEATEKATGAKVKDLKFEVFFDKDKDVDARLNASLYE